MSAATILIVDDSELIVMMLSAACEELGYRVASAGSLAEARERIESAAPSAAITDWNLPDSTDPVAALRAHSGFKDRPIVLISGTPQAELDRIAREHGADAAISKDAGLAGMSEALGTALARLLSV